MPVTDGGGWRPAWNIYRLEFGPDYAREDMRGCWARVRSAPLGKVLQPASMAVEIVRDFADCLIEWNVVDEHGNPVLPDYDGVMRQPEDVVLLLIREWQKAMTEVPLPLSEPSTDGGRVAPAPPMPLPMELADRVS